MARLTTVRHVVEALGREIMMDRLGVTSGSISNWLKDGRFPNRASMLVTLREECGARGYELDERLFGGAGAAADAA